MRKQDSDPADGRWSSLLRVSLVGHGKQDSEPADKRAAAWVGAALRRSDGGREGGR